MSLHHLHHLHCGACRTLQAATRRGILFCWLTHSLRVFVSEYVCKINIVIRFAEFYILLAGCLIVVLLIFIGFCCCWCRCCRGKEKKGTILPPRYPKGAEAVASNLQQPYNEQMNVQERGYSNAATALPRTSHELHANEQSVATSGPKNSHDSLLQRSSMVTSPDNGQNVPALRSLHLSSTTTSRTEGPMQLQNTSHSQSSHARASAGSDPQGDGLVLASLYQAAFPTRESTMCASTAVGGPQQAPGPDASSECKQEYVQYQIDSLGAAEVLDGLILQQGLRTRLLGGRLISLLSERNLTSFLCTIERHGGCFALTILHSVCVLCIFF
jgi:hypothetical protein